MDYFRNVIEEIGRHDDAVALVFLDFQTDEIDCSFDLLGKGASENVKAIYRSYSRFILRWRSRRGSMRGFVHFVPYFKLASEHAQLCALLDGLEADCIDGLDRVMGDIEHWYPVFLFPNGDRFCYDDRTGCILFFEHDVFDGGINLHGLLIADSLDALFERWSDVWFADIYDWSDGVDTNGIDAGKEAFSSIRQLQGS